MKHFDWNRFRLTLCYNFATGRRLLVRNMMYMLLAYLFIFFVAHVFMPFAGTDDYSGLGAEIARMRMEHVASFVAGLAIVMGSVFALVAVSGMFASEQTKQGRILTLMLPASNLEKFLSRWVFMVALTLAGTVVVFPVADLLHLLYCLVTGQPALSALPLVWENLQSGFLTGGLLFSLASVARLLTVHAFFLLGATLFRKHPFLLTASSLAILLAFFASTIQWLYQMFSSLVFYLLVICAICWLAYRLFCRWQVVTRKFTNL